MMYDDSEMMEPCYNCGHLNDSSAVMCENCGIELSKFQWDEGNYDKGFENENLTKDCPTCGYENSIYAEDCERCGKPLPVRREFF